MFCFEKYPKVFACVRQIPNAQRQLPAERDEEVPKELVTRPRVYPSLSAPLQRAKLRIIKYHSHTQHVPNPAAQGPRALPPLREQSGAVRQVPFSPEAPAHAWLLNWTNVNKDKTEKSTIATATFPTRPNRLTSSLAAAARPKLPLEHPLPVGGGIVAGGPPRAVLQQREEDEGGRLRTVHSWMCGVRVWRDAMIAWQYINFCRSSVMAGSGSERRYEG